MGSHAKDCNSPQPQLNSVDPTSGSDYEEGKLVESFEKKLKVSSLEPDIASNEETEPVRKREELLASDDFDGEMNGNLGHKSSEVPVNDYKNTFHGNYNYTSNANSYNHYKDSFHQNTDGNIDEKVGVINTDDSAIPRQLRFSTGLESVLRIASYFDFDSGDSRQSSQGNNVKRSATGGIYMDTGMWSESASLKSDEKKQKEEVHGSQMKLEKSRQSLRTSNDISDIHFEKSDSSILPSSQLIGENNFEPNLPEFSFLSPDASVFSVLRYAIQSNLIRNGVPQPNNNLGIRFRSGRGGGRTNVKVLKKSHTSSNFHKKNLNQSNVNSRKSRPHEEESRQVFKETMKYHSEGASTQKEGPSNPDDPTDGNESDSEMDERF